MVAMLRTKMFPDVGSRSGCAGFCSPLRVFSVSHCVGVAFRTMVWEATARLLGNRNCR